MPLIVKTETLISTLGMVKIPKNLIIREFHHSDTISPKEIVTIFYRYFVLFFDNNFNHLQVTNRSNLTYFTDNN